MLPVRRFHRWDLILKLPSFRSIMCGIIWYWLLMLLSLTVQWDFQIHLYWSWTSTCVLCGMEKKSNSEQNSVLYFSCALITCKSESVNHGLFQIWCQSQQGRLDVVWLKTRSILVSQIMCIKKLRKWSFMVTDIFSALWALTVLSKNIAKKHSRVLKFWKVFLPSEA